MDLSNPDNSFIIKSPGLNPIDHALNVSLEGIFSLQSSIIQKLKYDMLQDLLNRRVKNTEFNNSRDVNTQILIEMKKNQ